MGLSEAGWEAGVGQVVVVVERGLAVLGTVTIMLSRLRLLGAVMERVVGREGLGEMEAVAVKVVMVVKVVTVVAAVTVVVLVVD